MSQKKSLSGSFTRGIPAGNDLRVYSSGALSRSELRRDLQVKELCHEFYKNSNSRNCNQFEWNIEIISQNFQIQ